MLQVVYSKNYVSWLKGSDMLWGYFYIFSMFHSKPVYEYTATMECSSSYLKVLEVIREWYGSPTNKTISLATVNILKSLVNLKSIWLN